MTDDTKKALEIIEPMAKAFGIKVEADENIMHVEDPRVGSSIDIGITYNSTFATLKEFLGVLVYRHAFERGYDLTKKQEDCIQRYWRYGGLYDGE